MATKGWFGHVCFMCGVHGDDMAKAGMGNMTVFMCAGCVEEVHAGGPVFKPGTAKVVDMFTAKWVA